MYKRQIQRTDRGKQARQYFIAVEKAYNTPEKVMARGLKAAEYMLRQEQERRKQLEDENAMMRPKALFADAVGSSHTTILVGDLAKLLKQNGYDTGQKRLFERLRNEGYLIRQKGSSWNMPTQKSMELGLFEVKESTHLNPDGSTQITKTTKVTGKGQIYFVSRYTNNQTITCD